MKKIMKLSLLSIFVLAGCSFSKSLENRYRDQLNYPTYNSSNNSSNSSNSTSSKIEEVPINGGKNLDKKEFYSQYSDLDDYSYVLDNIEEVEDETTKEKLKNIYNIFTSNQIHQENEYSGKYEGYNVINIIGETLEIRFAHPILTPNLWNIINNSMYFENYYVSEFQEGATCNSEFMSHASLYPVVTSVWSGNMCQNENTTNDIFKFALPAQLEANGYNSYYFHLGYRSFYNRGNFIPNFGFKTNNIKFIHDIDCNDYVTDNYNLRFYERFVDFSKPFYISNLTYSMHGGYGSNSLGVNSEREARVLSSLDKDITYFKDMMEAFYYLQKLTYFDDFLGDLLNLLEEKGVKDKTIINIYRDHSPYMMNNNHYTKYMQSYHPELNYEKDSIIRFNHPLLIYDCGNPQSEIISYAGSTEDLVPTFLNLLGFDETNVSYKHFMGDDILSGNSLAFLSQQSTSNTNDMVIGENGVKLEYGDSDNFNGDEDEEAYYSYYLSKCQYYIYLMKDIVDTNYFEYYYYNGNEYEETN